MKDIKDLGVLMLGFAPWLLFLFLSGHTLASLERAIVISLVASLIFGFGELRRGYLLQWGTLVFFCACFLFVNLLGVVWVARQMDLLSNAILAAIMWLTIAAGRPFALQYARSDLPREQWNDPRLVQACRLITLVWASLMSLAVGVSIIRRSGLAPLPEGTYFAASLAIIATGLVFTTLYKRRKRLARAASSPEGASGTPTLA